MPSGFGPAGWPGLGRAPRLIVVRGCLRLPHRWAIARQCRRLPLAARVQSVWPQSAVSLLRCGGDSARFATGQLLLSSDRQSVIEGVLLLARPSHCWAVDGGRNVVTQSGAGIAPAGGRRSSRHRFPARWRSCEQSVRSSCLRQSVCLAGAAQLTASLSAPSTAWGEQKT